MSKCKLSKMGYLSAFCKHKDFNGISCNGTQNDMDNCPLWSSKK